MTRESNRRAGVHRTLSIRLTVATLLLSLVIGSIAYLVERETLATRIIERTALGVELLKAEYRRTIAGGTGAAVDSDAVQLALAALAQVLPRAQFGHFVMVAIEDSQGRELARLVDHSSTLASRIPEVLDQPSAQGPAGGPGLGRPVRLDDVTLVPVTARIVDEVDAPVAYLRGVFQVSPVAIEALQRGVWTSVLAVIAIVLLTALVLYPIIRALLNRLETLSIQLLDANLEVLRVLGNAIAKRDSDTDAHNYRVTVYAVRLAEARGVERHVIRALIKGAFLHDVGKIGIRDSILLKPGRLDRDEFEEMKKHVPHGVDIVRRSRWLENATDVVAHHHEKYDGSGYYRGLVGPDIPIAARIFAIVDVFDALTSERPYKCPMELEQALQILRDGAGTHFDPDLLRLFEAMAPSLHAAFGNRDAEPRLELELIVERYFRDDLAELMQEAVG